MRYSALTIGLHWLVVLLLIGVYACINLIDLFPRHSDPRQLLKTWHYLLGLTVLATTLLRLQNRLSVQAPKRLANARRWQHGPAHTVHAALYVFLLIMPLLGWLTLSAEGHRISISAITLPGLMATDDAWAHTLKFVHETIGIAGYYMIGLHAVVALFHHFVLRNETLARMLPFPSAKTKGPYVIDSSK